MFSIRNGNWKLEFFAGSGGVSYPSDGSDDMTGLAPIQLYDLSKDIGEQNNLQDKYPVVVKELTDLLASYVVAGRSTPGAKQRNHPHLSDGIWPGLEWMNI